MSRTRNQCHDLTPLCPNRYREHTQDTYSKRHKTFISPNLFSTQRDVPLIYGLPKHLPYYYYVVTAVLKYHTIYDACKNFTILISHLRLRV